MDLEDELAAARNLSVTELADAIMSIGFECTRCGACCKGLDGDHTATVFPDEVRELAGDTYDWRDVARPMPFGIEDGSGETFEWSLTTDACGDCSFYAENDGEGSCTVYENRPGICQTYPFSVDVAGTSPVGDVVDAEGRVRAHECEGLGRDIQRGEALELAESLKRRAVKELEEMVEVRGQYEPMNPPAGNIVVHDSEGAKRPDGSLIER